jgi:hypothetical protein
MNSTRSPLARCCLLQTEAWGFVPHIRPRSRLLYQESWSEWQDLNLRPPRPERGALPDCATLRLTRNRVYTYAHWAFKRPTPYRDSQFRAHLTTFVRFSIRPFGPVSVPVNDDRTPGEQPLGGRGDGARSSGSMSRPSSRDIRRRPTGLHLVAVGDGLQNLRVLN